MSLQKILDFYINSVKDMDYKAAQQWLKNDENFLCGLEIKDSHFDVYLFHSDGRNIIYVAFFNGSLLFSGCEYKPAMVHNHDSIESAVALMGWLCMKRGDTDSEYFDKYTLAQNKWSESMYCENLRMYINYFEDPNDPEHNEAVNYFTNWFIE